MSDEKDQSGILWCIVTKGPDGETYHGFRRAKSADDATAVMPDGLEGYRTVLVRPADGQVCDCCGSWLLAAGDRARFERHGCSLCVECGPVVEEDGPEWNQRDDRTIDQIVAEAEENLRRALEAPDAEPLPDEGDEWKGGAP
jgi:hypothetical protein